MFLQATSTIPDGSPLLRASFSAITFLTSALFVAAIFWSCIRTGLPRAVAAQRAALATVGCGVWIALIGLLAARACCGSTGARRQ